VGWKRIHGDLYYYRSVREGRKVRSVHVGGGELGRLAAQLDAMKRQWRHAEQVARAAELDDARDDALEQELDAMVADVRKQAAAVLEAAGYHQHARSQWRKKRADRDRETGRP
jgi:hypothetical protein